ALVTLDGGELDDDARFRVLPVGGVASPWLLSHELRGLDLQELVAATPPSSTAALLDAVEAALATSRAAMAERVATTLSGNAPLGVVVVLTDVGALAPAELAALQAVVDAGGHDVVTFAAIADDGADPLAGLASHGSFALSVAAVEAGADSDALPSRFAALSRRARFLAWCSGLGAGAHTLTIDAAGIAGATTLAGAALDPTADCAVADLRGPCPELCGGLWCGCDCEPGFTGPRCEDCADPRREPHALTGECVCRERFVGADCDACSAHFAGADCADCAAGYAGDHCEIDVDECAPNPCEHGAACVDGVATFTCVCPPGFSGDTCAVLPTGCDPDPCVNGGSCAPGAALGEPATCTCPAGLSGYRCETPLRVVDVAAGRGFTCALVEDGSVRCWGYAFDTRSRPVFLGGGPFEEIAASALYVCGARADGSVVCGGAVGSLPGAGEPAHIPAYGMAGYQPVTLDAPPLHGLDGGSGVICGLDAEGRVHCFGSSVGFGAPPPEGGFVAVTVGAAHACARRAAGQVVCWGLIAPPPHHALALMEAGNYVLFGVGADGRLDTFWQTGAGVDEPDGDDDDDFVALERLDGNGQRACALRADGRVACFGAQGTWRPPFVSYQLFTRLAGSAFHSCGVTVEGRVHCRYDASAPSVERAFAQQAAAVPAIFQAPAVVIPPGCGDGAVTGGEVCDSETRPCSEVALDLTGESTCLATCAGWNDGACARCGDGVRGPAEVCEPGDVTTCAELGLYGPGVIVACDGACGWGASACGPCDETLAGCPGGPECEEGACCDVASERYLPRGTPCGPTAQGGRYCSGDQILTATSTPGCSGASADCPTADVYTVYGAVDPPETCPSGLRCAYGAAGPTCEAPTCTNDQPCCANFAYRTPGSPCGATVVASEQRCGVGEVLSRTAVAGCSGDSGACVANPATYRWSPWSVTETCTEEGVCVEDTPGAPSCDNPVICDAGPCCDTVSRRPRPAGTICGQTATITLETTCSGDRVAQRQAARGCDGTSPLCSEDPADYVWSPWFTSACGAGEACHLTAFGAECEPGDATGGPGSGPAGSCGGPCLVTGACGVGKTCIAGTSLPTGCGGCPGGQQCVYTPSSCTFQ
ncbi:MAG: hypothetical protein KC635_24705, partial [Myxococcales bacterium]|nr:hypothetical protein [Myxococcales bacterium]